MNNTGDLLTKLRKEKGLTQQQAADALNVSNKTIRLLQKLLSAIYKREMTTGIRIQPLPTLIIMKTIPEFKVLIRKK